jgi:hexosaminidase
MNKPVLLPMPRQIESLSGQVTLENTGLIVIPDSGLLFEAQTVQRALLEYAGVSWSIVAGTDYPGQTLTLIVDSALKHPQGYALMMCGGQIVIRGADAAGVLYGVCTLRQLLQQIGRQLPALKITDWPDYPARGVMLDISRDKVPTLQTVLDLVEHLAGWKINQLQLYMEHTFAYRQHPEVWALASPFTGQEILELDIFCRQRHVELVPNQNSLGHMERWLRHDRYFPLAETPDGFELPWGGHSQPTTLNPLDPGSIALIASLYDELLPHFTSHLLNVGGDEPWELGQGRSKAEVESRGKGRVYLDYLLKLYDLVTVRGRQMQFWGDIIIHYPELVPELPHDVIAMEWGYEADHPFDEHGALFAGHNVPFYVVPGTSSWNTLLGRTDNALGNLHNAAVSGLRHGAVGYLNTDWGDGGHWQPLPVSYPGFAYGAAVSWSCDTNHDLNLPRALDFFAFEDSAGIMGKLVCDLGNIYRAPGLARGNGSRLFDILRTPASKLSQEISSVWGIQPDTLRATIAQIDAIMQSLDSAAMKRPDAVLIQGEFAQAANLARHACQRGLWILGEPDSSPAMLRLDLNRLVPQQRQNWLARNRRGGLEDSMGRFNHLVQEYAVP